MSQSVNDRRKFRMDIVQKKMRYFVLSWKYALPCVLYIYTGNRIQRSAEKYPIEGSNVLLTLKTI